MPVRLLAVAFFLIPQPLLSLPLFVVPAEGSSRSVDIRAHLQDADLDEPTDTTGIDPQPSTSCSVWTWRAPTRPDQQVTPTLISGLHETVAVAAGDSHALALKNDGTVWAWGSNQYGQLGDGTTTDRSAPVQVSDLSDVRAVAAAGEHNLALKRDGTVWAWGDNHIGQLGDGSPFGDASTSVQTAPVRVTGLSGVTAIAAGISHSMALLPDGTVWAWGRGYRSPAPVSGISGATAIAAGFQHGLAIRTDGTVWAWNDWLPRPQQVADLSGVWAVSTGSMARGSLALLDNGTVWAWGFNLMQLGVLSAPFEVTGPTAVTAIAAAADDHWSYVVQEDGSVWTWRLDMATQLQDPSDSRQIPTPVRDISGARQVATGSRLTVALTCQDHPSP